MSAPTVNTRHTVTGKLQRLTLDQVSSLPKYLEVVEDDAKPYEPGMFKPGKVGEFKNSSPTPQALAGKAETKSMAKATPSEGAGSSDSSDSKGDRK